MCSQFCPFSPVSDDDAGPFTPIANACGQGNRDISITNTTNDRTIKFGSLITHLIGEHHFFEGQVPYRLDPTDVIDTLELEPESDFSLPPPNSLSTAIEESVEIESKSTPKWELTGIYPMASQRVPEQLASVYEIELVDFGNNIKGLILPYYHVYDDQTEMGTNTKAHFLHLFNMGEKNTRITGTVNGLRFTDISVPAHKRVILATARFESSTITLPHL